MILLGLALLVYVVWARPPLWAAIVLIALALGVATAGTLYTALAQALVDGTICSWRGHRWTIACTSWPGCFRQKCKVCRTVFPAPPGYEPVVWRGPQLFIGKREISMAVLVLLLLAGPLAAQGGPDRWYGRLALSNAVLELYITDHPTWGRTPVVTLCSAKPPLNGQCMRFEAGRAAFYVDRLREGVTKLAAGDSLELARSIRDYGTARARCSATGCTVTVTLVGRLDSLRTSPLVPPAYLLGFAEALEAAGRRDTAFVFMRDSLP
jgi:hypothetical protein